MYFKIIFLVYYLNMQIQKLQINILNYQMLIWFPTKILARDFKMYNKT